MTITHTQQTPISPLFRIPQIRRLLLIVGMSLLAPNAPAIAQPGSPAETSGTSTHLSTPAAPVVLENTPIRIDALNLSISLPKGSVTETTRFGTNATMGVGLPDQLGIMIIKEQKTSNPDLTIAQVADNIIKQLTRPTNSSSGTVLSRDRRLNINFWTGERFYVKVSGANGNPDIIRGMTIFQSQPQKFIIFDLSTTGPNFEKARLYYETSVSSMDLGNPTDIDLRRAAAIKSMLAFLDQRTIKDYQDAMTTKKDRWERLYRPSPTGDDMDATEYGYRRIRSWGGFKGELTDKPRKSWNNDDRSLGYFVQIDAMALEDDIRVDTKATFYLAEDFKDESWTIKMSLRQDGEQQTSTITGARSGTSMAIMLDQSDVQGATKSHPLIQGEGYMSQVQTYLIGSLLANHAEPGKYASYAYNSSLGTIALRWDVVTKPEDTPGLTKITTKVSNETPPIESYYNERGDLMRVRLSDGRIWEPIELDRLIKLWRKKGLPLD